MGLAVTTAVGGLVAHSARRDELPVHARESRASLVESALRVPLVAKLAGANAVIVAGVLLACLVTRSAVTEGVLMVAVLLALGASVIVSAALVGLALRPLADLEDTAAQIRAGNRAARVPENPLADARLRRVGLVLNELLDDLAQDRARLHDLTTKVIRAGDTERAHIARELHDSAAQTLAALMLELRVMGAEAGETALGGRIERVRKIIGDVLGEVKALAHVVHPRVLDDLGLSAALRHLAREAEAGSAVPITVEGDAPNNAVGAGSASTLYRVAQEAVGNAIRHAKPAAITIRLAVDNGAARVEIEDNGSGFDPAEAERLRPGMGLFTMKERTALVGGEVHVQSEKGKGTRVIVTVPSAPDHDPATLMGSGSSRGISQ